MMTKDFFKTRPLSWSAISSFEYDKEKWYETYILGKRQTSKEMTFGSMVDKRIQDDPKFLPDLPRYPLMQYDMKVKFGDIMLTGRPDGLDLDNFLLADYKTGKNKWDKKRADETGQLTMYLLLVYVTHKIPPEKFDCMIHWLPTQENGDFTITFKKKMKHQTFKTKRNMTDLLRFGVRINKITQEMIDYANNYEKENNKI